MYVLEALDRVGEQTGGKYGYCVICREPADFHCKDTRVSLCGPACKTKHLELANKYNNEYARASSLLDEIIEMLEETLTFLDREPQALKARMAVVEILNTVLKKPYLFMLVEPRVAAVLKKYIPSLLNKLFAFKDNYEIELAFSLMCSLVKYWKSVFLTEI